MAKSSDSKATKKNPIAASRDFIQESLDEVKKVHPPTKQETIQGTIGVIIMVFFFGLFLGLSDLAVGKLMQWILT
jgi:preprotein translocase SecE subunit